MNYLFISQNRQTEPVTPMFKPWKHIIHNSYYLGEGGNTRYIDTGIKATAEIGIRIVVYLDNSTTSAAWRYFTPAGVDTDFRVFVDHTELLMDSSVRWGGNNYTILGDTTVAAQEKIIHYVNLPTPTSNGEKEAALYRISNGEQVRMGGQILTAGTFSSLNNILLFRQGSDGTPSSSWGINPISGLYQVTIWQGEEIIADYTATGNDQMYEAVSGNYITISGDGELTLHND